MHPHQKTEVEQRNESYLKIHTNINQHINPVVNNNSFQIGRQLSQQYFFVILNLHF